MKSIHDYDLKSFNSSDRFGRRLDVAHDQMWLIDKHKRLDTAINNWLEVDNSPRSQDKLFYEMFYAVFHNEKCGRDIFHKMMDYFKIEDKHCAFVWDRLPSQIPQANSYKYSSYLLQFMENFQYKEFKKSLINNALDNECSGFFYLAKLHAKNMIGIKEAMKIMMNPNLIISLGDELQHVKLPLKYNKNAIDFIKQNIKSLDFYEKASVDNRYKVMLIEIIKNTLSQYYQENLHEILDECEKSSKFTQKCLKSEGIFKLLLNNKLQHTIKKSDAIIQRAKI